MTGSVAWPLATSRGIRLSSQGLKELDLGFNPLGDLGPLASLPALDGAALDLRPLASLPGLRRLSVRHNLLEDLQPLAGLDGLRRLDLRGSSTRDLRALGGLPSLVWVHVGGSRIEDLTALESLDGLTVEGQDDLESLAPGEGRVQDPPVSDTQARA